MDSQPNTIYKPQSRILKYLVLFYVSIVGVITGSFIYYFFEYRYIREALWISTFLIVFGWFGILHSIFPELLNGSKKRIIPWLPQTLFRILSVIVLTSFLCGNLNYITDLEKARENNILTNEPTLTTKALITEAEVRKLKNGTRHYAHIRYIANGDTINQERPDDQFQFQAGGYYTVKYSIKLPQMFKLYPK